MGIQRYLLLCLLLLCANSQDESNITQAAIPRPIIWEHLWRCFVPDLTGTLRSIQGEEFYIEFKAYIKEKNISMAEYVKAKILGYQNDPQFPIFYIKTIKINGTRVNVYVTGEKPYLREYMSHPKKFKIRKGIKQNSRFILITKNNFPYDLQRGISHWVVWSNRDYPFEVIQTLLGDVMLPDIEWKIFQNAITMKSIPQISHKQVFLRHRAMLPSDQSL